MFKSRIGTVVLAGIVGFIFWEGLPPCVVRYIDASFDVKAERGFACSLYFKEKGNSPFRHVDTRVNPGESHICLSIPAERIEQFRIDYGVAPGHVESSPVRLTGAKDDVLEWRDFTTYNDIAKHEILANGWLALDSQGGDPYVVCGKQLDIRAGLHFNGEKIWNGGKIWFRLLLLIAALVVIIWRVRIIAFVCRWGISPVSGRFDAVIWLGNVFRARMLTVVLACVVGYIFWSSLPSCVVRGSGIIDASFDVKAERCFDCSILFKEKGDSPYRHVNARVNPGGSHIRLSIPADRIERFRVDYGSAPGHVESSPIRLSGAKNEVLAWTDFTTYNDIAKHEILANGWLALDSQGGDPYVVCGNKLDVRPVRRFNWNKVGLRFLLLIAALVVIIWRVRIVASVCRIVASVCRIVASVCRWVIYPVSARFDAVCSRWAWVGDTFRGRMWTIVLAGIFGYLIWARLSPCGVRGIEASFDVKAERSFVCSFYFKEKGNDPFRHVDTRVYPGESHIRLLIPAYRIEQFRVDYGAAPGHVVSSPVRLSGGIRLSGGKDKVLEWRDFTTYNDIAKHEILANGWLALDSQGRDPHTLYGKKIDINAGFHVYKKRSGARVLLLLAAVVGLFWRTRIVKSVRESIRVVVCRWVVNPISRWFEVVCHSLYIGFRALLPDRSFAIYMAVVILLAWGFELFNFTYTSDDDVVLYGGFQSVRWLQEGRWGMHLLATVLGNNSVPVFPLFITLFLYALSFAIVFDRLGRAKYFIFPVYAAFPVVYQSFTFTSLHPGVGIAFFMAALAVRLLDSGIVGWCAAVLLGATSIGCYQIFIFFMAIAVVVRFMDKVCRGEKTVAGYAAYVLRGCCLVVLSYLAYKAISYGFQHMTGVAESYVTNRYLDPPRSLSDWRTWWPYALTRASVMLTGEKGLVPSSISFYPVLLISAFGVGVAWMLFSRRPLVERHVLFFSCISLLLLAFSPLAFNRRAMVLDRIIVLLVPMALAGILAFAAHCITGLRACSMVGGALCVLCSFQFVWCINKMTYSNYLRNKYDAAFLAMVRSRVETLPEVAMRRSWGLPVPLLVVGRCEFDRRGAVRYGGKTGIWPDWERDNVGRSLLVEPGRWRFAMKACLGIDYTGASAATIPKGTQQFIEGMPIWPLTGSVVWRDGLAIVKFSDFAPQPASPTRKLNRRLCLCRDARVNGFDELVQTDVVGSERIHVYKAGEVLSSSAKTAGLAKDGMLLEASTAGGAALTLKPYENATVPYQILEFRLEAERDAVMTLWRGDLRQECQFVLFGGGNVLRLRVPAEFLSVPLRLDFGSSTGARVKVMGVDVYADRKFTERLLALNPDLKN